MTKARGGGALGLGLDSLPELKKGSFQISETPMFLGFLARRDHHRDPRGAICVFHREGYGGAWRFGSALLGWPVEFRVSRLVRPVGAVHARLVFGKS